MKKFVLVALLVFTLHGLLKSQTKIDEYNKLISDDEHAHLFDLAERLKKDASLRSALIVHKPAEIPLGSFLRYFHGLRETLEQFGITSSRFQLIFGGELPNRKTEIWLLKPAELLPKSGDIKLSALLKEPIRRRTLFDTDCLDCDRSPFIDQWIFGGGLDHLTNALRENPSLSGEILIGRMEDFSKTKSEQAALRQKIITKLVHENAIGKNRIKIRFLRSDFVRIYLMHPSR